LSIVLEEHPAGVGFGLQVADKQQAARCATFFSLPTAGEDGTIRPVIQAAVEYFGD
jgi:hypothetical protein